MMSSRRSDVSSSSDTPNGVARTSSVCSPSLLGEDDFAVLTKWLDMNVEDIRNAKDAEYLHGPTRTRND